MTVKWFENTFSQSVGCLFIWFVSFAVQKLLNLSGSHLFIFVFNFHYSGSCIEKDTAVISVGRVFCLCFPLGFPGGISVKNPTANAGDTDSIPRWERCPGGGNDTPLQYSCLRNPIYRVAWRAMVHRVTKSWTQLKQLSMQAFYSVQSHI